MTATQSVEADNILLELLTAWTPIDLEPVLTGTYETPVPTILKTRDGTQALFYRGCVNAIHGDSGVGKSWIALAAVAQVLNAGQRALILDYEANANETVARLLALGVDRCNIAGKLSYIQPTLPTSDMGISFVEDVVFPDTDLVVIDSLGEAFGLDSIDENSDADVGPWLRRVARRLANAGPAVLLIDHGTKAGDNPLHGSGSKRKKAAYTGSSFLVTSPKPFTRDQAGVLTLTCAKDRHGTYRRGEVIATADVTPYPDGGVTVHFHPAMSSDQKSNPADAVRVVARKVIRHVRDAGRPMSGNEIAQTVNVKAATPTKRAAIDLAVGEGALTETAGPRNARLFSYVRDLEEGDNQ